MQPPYYFETSFHIEDTIKIFLSKAFYKIKRRILKKYSTLARPSPLADGCGEQGTIGKRIQK